MSLTPELRARIDALLAQHTVVLFMKGTRTAPRCGFSAGAARTLAAVTPDFHEVDVIADPEIREAIKVYGQWPTIPQLYVRGELVGGADILNDMANSGALHELTPAGTYAYEFSWSPDGTRIAFEDARGQLVMMDSNGAQLHYHGGCISPVWLSMERIGCVLMGLDVIDLNTLDRTPLVESPGGGGFENLDYTPGTAEE